MKLSELITKLSDAAKSESDDIKANAYANLAYKLEHMHESFDNGLTPRERMQLRHFLNTTA